MPEISIEMVERPMAEAVRNTIRETHMAYLEKLLAQYRRGLMTDAEYLNFVELELATMQGEMVFANVA